MSIAFERMVMTRVGSRLGSRTASTLKVRGCEYRPALTLTLMGIMSGLRPIRPDTPVLTSVSMTPTTFSGEPIFMLTLVRG